jgi:predicted Zn-dependent protease with MMP-like domain
MAPPGVQRPTIGSAHPAIYSGVLRTKITIYRGPLVRLYGQDTEGLRREVRRVVLHEVAHHFGISDERLIEIDRY